MPSADSTPRLREGVSRRLPREARAPALVLALGALAMAFLLGIHVDRERQIQQDLELEDAIHRFEVEVASSHLWLEELLTGDQYVDENESIWDRFERAERLLKEVLEGRHGERGENVSEPLRDPELRRQAEVLADKLRAFERVSRERHRTRAGIGSDLDQEFDEMFIELLRDGETLREGLVESMTRSRTRARRRLGVVIAAWALLVAAAAFELWRRERHRRIAEESLRQREAELRHSQKLEALGQLAGGIAHDINNYLGAIRGYCEVARMNCDDEAQARRLDAAMETASEASGLIEQILAFSRRQPSRPEIVDLNQVVAKMERMMRQLLGERVRLETDCDPELWSVEADASQLEQIVVNLLVNSRDAMPQGGEILLRTRNLEKAGDDGPADPAPGRYAVVSVVDTGAGIPYDLQGRIFEPFFTTKDVGSSGLGLATVHGIVQQNEGYIAVDSQPGRGTTFEIYFPAHEGPATDRSAGRRKSAAPRPSAIDGQVKVLLVEDNPRMRDSTESLLVALGYEVRVARDGDGALRILDEEDTAFDLVISDVIMPGLSGPELLDRIRERHPDLGCLFISGFADKVPLRREKRSDFLAKPFTAADLADKIDGLLKAGDRPSP